jgi:hypothetical protein
VIVKKSKKDRRTQHSQSSPKCTLFRISSNSRERVGYDGNKQVDEPEIENDDASNKEETRDKKLRIDDLVHEW